MISKFRLFLLIAIVITCYCNIIHSEKNDSITVSFIGDCIMHGPVKSFAFRNNIIDPTTKRSINNNGFDILFEYVKPELTNSDYVVANMEFPIAPPFTSKAFIFNCSPQVLDAFKNININIVSIANNHILDQGYEGLLTTIKILASKNILYIGAGKYPQSTINGIIIGNSIKVGIIAYTGVLNYGLSSQEKRNIFINDFYNTKKVLNDIETIKRDAHFLVMIAHIGKEYSTQPSREDEDLIKKYCEAGVDCVIGHHPHVIQPVKQFRTNDRRLCTVFYSLGNFIANQSSKHLDTSTRVECSTREGLIVTLMLEKDNESIKQKYKVVPLLIYNIPDTESKYGRRIQPIPMHKMINDGMLKTNNEDTQYVIKRLQEIKKHLFHYGEYENIQYTEN